MVRFVFAVFLLAAIALVTSCGSGSVRGVGTIGGGGGGGVGGGGGSGTTVEQLTVIVAVRSFSVISPTNVITIPPLSATATVTLTGTSTVVQVPSITVTFGFGILTLELQSIVITAGTTVPVTVTQPPITVIQRLSLPPTSAGATMTIVTLPATVPTAATAATTVYIPLTSTNTNAINPCLGANALLACTTYVSYPEILTGVLSLALVHSDYVAAYSIGVTYEGRLIPAIKISDNPQDDENEAVVLIVGGYHAREWLAINFVYLLVEYLLANKNTPAVKWHLDNSEIWIVPLVNADGRVHDASGNTPYSWRKNRRPFLDSVGDTVAFGVDLNRNHSFLWGEAPQTVATRWGSSVTLMATNSRGASSGDFNALTYRGTAPTSEPETKAICNLAHKIYPDVGISYHTYTQLLLYPWGYTEGRGATPDDEYSIAMSIAVEASVQIVAVHGKAYVAQPGSALYATNGDFGDWMFGVLGAYSYTPELRPTIGVSYGFYPPPAEITPTFEENIPAALHFIRAAILNDRAIDPLFTPQYDCRI